MESSAARVASLMLRRNSRKDTRGLGTLFSQWSARTPCDLSRRMTMGGAAPEVATPPAPVQEPPMDAFCAVQLAPSNSLTRAEAYFLLSPKGSFSIPSGLLLTPTASLKDAGALLSPQASIGKLGLDALLSHASFSAAKGSDDGPLISKSSLAPPPMPVAAPLS